MSIYMANCSTNTGYNVKNIDLFNRRYICLCCRLILKDPVQLKCGHRICFVCISTNETYIPCPECLEMTESSQIRRDKGHGNEMQTLPVSCSSCEWSGLLKDYYIHLEQIHKQYDCSYCNEPFSSVIALNQHKQQTCLNMPINCILHDHGCHEQFLRRHAVQHYLSEIHQRTLVLCAKQIPVDLYEKSHTLGCSDTNPERITTTKHQEYINDVTRVLAGSIEMLNNDLQKLSDESLQQTLSMGKINQDIKVLKTSCEESNAMINAHATNMEILKQENSTLKQTITEYQSASYDGTLLWRITDVHQKMIDAQSEKLVSIYSPPFYSSPTGYKACARLYPYGDGNARRTHMSLFFVLMRSVHDSLLSFPFKFKVTFCLYDQTGQQQHIIDSFRPDERSNSFQRPQCDMNIASGIPKFVPLAILQQSDSPYIKDDTMFIKIWIDFENLPKAILPYAMNLNPGFPVSLQQKLIHQEIECRKKANDTDSIRNNHQQQMNNNTTMEE